MKWYKTEEKIPNRGDRIMLVGNKYSEHDVMANFIFDVDFYDSDKATRKHLEEYTWPWAKERFQYWGYMDDFIKEVMENENR